MRERSCNGPQVAENPNVGDGGGTMSLRLNLSDTGTLAPESRLLFVCVLIGPVCQGLTFGGYVSQGPRDRPAPLARGSPGTASRSYRQSDIGGFAEEIVVHHRSAVRLPETIPPSGAALLGCGVLTGVGAAINGAKVRPGSQVVVIGCGGLRLNVIQGARIAGANRIFAIDNSAEKLALARTFGATDGILAGSDAVGAVVEASGGGVDYAFEVIGQCSLLRDAFMMLRKHGTLIVVGMPKTGSEMSFPVLTMMYKNLRIITSGMGDAPFQLFIPQLARWYVDGRLKLDELVSRRIRLSEIGAAYAGMASGTVARNVITF